jgi:hypothetical protein
VTKPDASTPLILSREDLYELAWSKPMSELAKDFGISDVALAKRCRRLGIPVPGRGYWARVDSGQTPYRPKLPQREPQWYDPSALSVAPSQEAPSVIGCSRTDTIEGLLTNSLSDSAHSETDKADAAWLTQRIDYEERPENRIQVPEATRTWAPVIRTFRDDLEEAATEMRESRKAFDRYEKWPESRKRVESCNESRKWRWSKDRGQRLWDTHKSIAFRVSLGTYERALGIANALALATEERGVVVRDDEEAGRLVFASHDAEIQMRITEQLEEKTRPRSSYDGKTEHERYKLPTGRLRISMQTGYREGPTFEDRGTQKLESILNRVFVAMYRLVVKCWVQDRAHRAAALREKEAERQRAEKERIRAERQRKALQERRRRKRLSREAGRWNKARNIREYVAHIRSSATLDSNLGGSTAAWAAWASAVADAIDPTMIQIARHAHTKCDP